MAILKESIRQAAEGYQSALAPVIPQMGETRTILLDQPSATEDNQPAFGPLPASRSK